MWPCCVVGEAFGLGATLGTHGVSLRLGYLLLRVLLPEHQGSPRRPQGRAGSPAGPRGTQFPGCLCLPEWALWAASCRGCRVLLAGDSGPALRRPVWVGLCHLRNKSPSETERGLPCPRSQVCYVSGATCVAGHPFPGSPSPEGGRLLAQGTGTAGEGLQWAVSFYGPDSPGGATIPVAQMAQGCWEWPVSCQRSRHLPRHVGH